MPTPPVNFGEAVYGMRELEIAPIVGGNKGAWVPWSGVSLEFGIETETAEQKANDIVIATVTLNTRASFKIEAGHAPFEVLVAIYGSDLVTTNPGTANEEKALTVNVDDDAAPAFAIRGRMIGGKNAAGGGGGDMLMETIGGAYATSGFTASFANGSWWSPGVEGVILPDAAGDLFKLIQRATAAVLS